MSFKSLSLVLAIIIGVYVYYKYGQETPAQLVSDFHITSDKEGNNLEFGFANPVRYLGHFPEDSSDVLQVKLRAIGFGDFAENFSLLDQFIPATETQEKFLEDVRYEGDVPGGPFIVVRFTKPMNYRVTESNGLKGLIISYKRN
ncbi:MAG: hypothetical protein L0Z73_14870 [Gammaproteobacteria bacterium]|nr:hypothetical protein [Gammaproteobacteria bacterium]